MSKELKVGEPAPDFSAAAIGAGYPVEGKKVSLRDFAGKNVVLYFYPKDDTPGCTKQACGLRDAWAQLRQKAVIFGVSVDDEKSHRDFIDKFSLPFPLLSDHDKKMVGAYDVWVEKDMNGKTYMGTERSTFIIGPDGKLRAILRKVKPEEHVDALLAVLK